MNLADGTRILAEIEREMLRLHSDLFPSIAHASEYVTKVLMTDLT
jgi:hypothetical protein